MKNQIACLLLVLFFANCSNAPKEPDSIPATADPSEIKTIGQKLIIDSFDEIFSNLDSTKITDYYTEDFLLLENGLLWNNDSIANFQRRSLQRAEIPTRINKFDFIETKVYDHSVWMAYHNNATFFINKELVGEANWLESAVAVKTEKGWLLEMLHSTYVQKE